MHLPIEGRLERGFEGLDVGQTLRVELVSTNVKRGYIFEFVYTPKHGSWLNMAEIELNVLTVLRSYGNHSWPWTCQISLLFVFLVRFHLADLLDFQTGPGNCKKPLRLTRITSHRTVTG